MSNSRPPLSQGNRGGQSEGLAPPASAPSTPSKTGKALSERIHRLSQYWQLGLVRDENWSPHKSSKDLPDKVYTQLKQLYWRGNFDEAVERFVLQAKPPSPSDTQAAKTKRLSLLHEIVRDIDPAKGRSPGSRAGTPVNGKDPTPGLQALKTDQSCEFNFIVLGSWTFAVQR